MNREEILNKELEIDGNTFYSFKSLDMLPKLRKEAIIARHFEYTEMRIQHSRLLAFCETVEEFGNQGRFMDVQQLNGYFKNLLQKPITLYTMIYMASPMVVLNDEPIEKLSPEFEAKKTELALSIPDVESFFLKTTIVLIPSISDSLQPGQTRVYLNQKDAIVENLFQELISGKLTLI
jgi:hypothetical protein